MATGDGFTSKLLVGLAEHLDTGGVGTWRETGKYEADEIAIVMRDIPQTPDRVITLAAYPIGTTLQGLADHQVGIQLRVRGTTDPRVCSDIGDAFFDLLDSASGLTWGGIAVVQVWRQSAVSLGQDANGRWESSHNYYADVMRPTASRTD